MTKKQGLAVTPARIQRGAAVLVREANTRPWTGRAIAVKWSSVSGWWVDVARDGSGNAVWSMAEACVSAQEGEQR